MLGSLPTELRRLLIDRFNEIQKNFRSNHYEPSELNAAKFCEVVLRVLQWHANAGGGYLPVDKHVRNFSQSCSVFEGNTDLDDSVRFHIPSLMKSVHGIRNKRGVGHIHSTINPNHMDAVLVERVCAWIMSELIRIFDATDIQGAVAQVEALCDFPTPLVWIIGSKRRILKVGLSYKDKVLVLLLSEFPKPVMEDELHKWLEHSNKSVLRRDIIKPAHRAKLIEYDHVEKMISLSPTGRKYAEELIAKHN